MYTIRVRRGGTAQVEWRSESKIRTEAEYRHLRRDKTVTSLALIENGNIIKTYDRPAKQSSQ